MTLQPIHTEADYKAALAITSKLVDKDPKPGTPDGNRLDALATLIEAYEAKHFLAPMNSQTESSTTSIEPLARTSDYTPVANVNRGGRPKRLPLPPEELSIRERLRDVPAKKRRSGNIAFALSDLSLCEAIARAKHGKRGAFVKQLARKKQVTETAIWNHLARILTYATLFDRLNKQDALARVQILELRTLLAKEPIALAGVMNLPIEDYAWLIEAIRDATVSEYQEAVDALKNVD